MEGIVLIIVSFSLFLLSYLLLERTREGLLFSTSNIIILSVDFLWGILFPIIYFYSLSKPNNIYLKIISEYTALDIIIYYFCINLFLWLFIKVFRLISDKKYINISSIFMSEENSKFGDKKSDQLYIATILLFVVGICSDFLYCRAYGGYLGYLEYSSFIRSGITDLVKNRWSFLIVFRDCVIISSYLLYSQIKDNGSIKITRMVLFVMSFIYSLLILYANKGRLTFIIYIAVFLITFYIDKRKNKYIRLNSILLAMAMLVVAMFGVSWISDLVGRSSAFSVWESFCNEVAFVFANFKSLLNEMSMDDARLFLDIISYPMFLIPSSIWRKFMPETASDILTIMINGEKKGQGTVFGETPIDAISIGYLQLGIIGVCVFAIFFGVIAAKLYNRVSKIRNVKTRGILVVNIIIDIFIRSLCYADSYNIVQRCFSLVVFALIYWACGHIKFKKNRVT